MIDWSKAEYKGMAGRAVYMKAHAWAYTWGRFADRRNIPCQVGGELRTWYWLAQQVADQAEDWPNASSVLRVVKQIISEGDYTGGRIAPAVDLGWVLSLADELEPEEFNRRWCAILEKHELWVVIEQYKANTKLNSSGLGVPVEEYSL